MLSNKKKFAEELQEVVDFALKGDILFGDVRPSDLDIVVIERPPKDWWDAGPDGKDYSELGENEWTYRDIVEEERSLIIKELSSDENKNKLSNQIIKFLSEKEKIYKKIEKKLKRRIENSDLYADFIESDILSCAEGRICFGRKDSFWETVFQIYKSGGMPVGWSGNYPEGKLMAIYPGLER
jgi:hypothetical protein